MKVDNRQLITETLPYDSQEARQEFLQSRIQVLEHELNQLNLLDHPQEIQTICKEIIAIKEVLGKTNPVTK